MLKLFFLCLTVVTITASPDFPPSGYDADACYANTLLASCFEAMTVPSDLSYTAYGCYALSYESKCWEKYCSTKNDAGWKTLCADGTSPLKPTANLPKLPSTFDATTTSQASEKTRAPLAGVTTSPSSTATARVGLQSSGASSAPLRTAKANMGALAIMLLLRNFL